ncbi:MULTISPECIES: hypothetical protein [unclassified Microcoleus]|uniref:hypothetical protein n=1 Tax=unclassified Microcoleus TaxID=2642155 RepID=UPI001D738E86|nr:MULTISPECIES: hypothetical protein [unclassified Microcoleus]MCC3415214.1 hypothetical protein [Microcoleus sp. PH2017_02_FOX_O_A]MCC3519274.1 hypothetical protein [Microcoleus sp. PH2017_18_LLB_O_A]MCC3620626.1 hypothetical protein [Microcoleus sp. PH2017_36_ELK_O_B]
MNANKTTEAAWFSDRRAFAAAVCSKRDRPAFKKSCRRSANLPATNEYFPVGFSV